MHLKLINSISSYSLSCDIMGRPVSLLADMGAGVSLLNKEVWDGVKTREKQLLNPVISH